MKSFIIDIIEAAIFYAFAAFPFVMAYIPFYLKRKRIERYNNRLTELERCDQKLFSAWSNKFPEWISAWERNAKFEAIAAFIASVLFLVFLSANERGILKSFHAMFASDY